VKEVNATTLQQVVSRCKQQNFTVIVRLANMKGPGWQQGAWKVSKQEVDCFEPQTNLKSATQMLQQTSSM